MQNLPNTERTHGAKIIECNILNILTLLSIQQTILILDEGRILQCFHSKYEANINQYKLLQILTFAIKFFEDDVYCILKII